MRSGDIDAAEKAASTALERYPNDTSALCAMAAVLAERGSFDEASACAERVAAKPDAGTEQLCAAAEIYRRAGRDRLAVATSERACRADPGMLAAWVVLAQSLEALGRFREAYEAYKRAVGLDPGNRDLHSTLLYMLYVSGLFEMDRIADEHRAWASLHADPLMPDGRTHDNSPEPDRVLRIGYLSPDFRRHVVGDFIEPVLVHHDRSAFQVYCYFTFRYPDARTAVLRRLADVWRDASALTDDQIAALIAADGIDVLIDLSGHTRGNKLPVFARRPAPVQMTWLGYLGTTGMKAMDYCITDAYTDPAGLTEHGFVEKLLRLPITQWCYSAPVEAPPVSPLPALTRGYVTFGSFSNYSRLNRDVFAAWARILRCVPGSRLLVVGATAGDATDRLFEAMDRAGIASDRIELCGRKPYREYFGLLSSADIALASFPFTGATTTCEALWMGLPVICRIGEARAARSSASILNAAGLSELIAADWDRYCATAIDLASDLERLNDMRAALRGRMQSSPLMDGRRFTAEFEKQLRWTWRNWCASTGSHAKAAHERAQAR